MDRRSFIALLTLAPTATAAEVSALATSADRTTSWPSRRALVGAISTLERTPGRIHIAEGRIYQVAPGATAIPDLPELLPFDVVTPEHFGALGGVRINPATGALTANDDTAAIIACRDYCMEGHKTMMLKSAYWIVNKLSFEHPIIVQGAGKGAGIYIDTDSEHEGLHIISSHVKIRDIFISVKTDRDIQSGQGNFGTCVTVGQIYYPFDKRVPGETDVQYANRIMPHLVSGVELDGLRYLRRPGGGGHAIAICGRVSGVKILNSDFQGWNAVTGRHATALLTHWGSNAEPFLADEAGKQIRPLIFRKADAAYTFHPNGVSMSKSRLRNVGRLASLSSSYNISIREVDYDGYDDNIKANGQQFVLLVAGDDADRFACPDDKGKVYSNFTIDGGVGFNLDGTSPNPAGTGLLDWPGSATSKYLNRDGSLARDDLQKIIYRYEPKVIPPKGTVTEDFAVAGARTSDSDRADAWFSNLDSTVEISATIPREGTVKVAFTNRATEAVNLPTGTLSVYVSKPRYFHSPFWSNIRFANLKLRGLGSTGSAINIRNVRASAVFENCDVGGQVHVDGLLIQQCAGNFSFKNCKIAGSSRIVVSRGLAFDGCVFSTNPVMSLTLSSTKGLKRGDTITGMISGTVGAVTQVVSKTVVEARAQSASEKSWKEGEEISAGAVAATLKLLAPLTVAAVSVSGDKPIVRTLASGLVSGTSTALKFTTAISRDVKPGDKFVVPGGVVYAREYHRRDETEVSISPSPVTVPPGAKVTLVRRSGNISFESCEVVGGDQGLTIANSEVAVEGGTVRDGGLYGVMISDSGSAEGEAALTCRDVEFSNNGMQRLTLDRNAATCDAYVGAGGSIHLDKCRFRNSSNVEYNVAADPTAIGGSIRDCSFTSKSTEGGPIADYLNVSSGFVASGNRTTGGKLIDN